MSVTHIDRCRYSHGTGRGTVLLLYGTVLISYPGLTLSYAGDLGTRLGIYVWNTCFGGRIFTQFPSQLRTSQWGGWGGGGGGDRCENGGYISTFARILINQCEMNCRYLRTDKTDMVQFLLVSAKRSGIPKKATSYPYLCKSLIEKYWTKFWKGTHSTHLANEQWLTLEFCRSKSYLLSNHWKCVRT